MAATPSRGCDPAALEVGRCGERGQASTRIDLSRPDRAESRRSIPIVVRLLWRLPIGAPSSPALAFGALLHRLARRETGDVARAAGFRGVVAGGDGARARRH